MTAGSNLMAFIREVERLRDRTVGCVGFKPDTRPLRPCERKPVAWVHPTFGEEPQRKCQYHLDALMEFCPRSIVRVVPIREDEVEVGV